MNADEVRQVIREELKEDRNTTGFEKKQGKYWLYTWFEIDIAPQDLFEEKKKDIEYHVYQLEKCPDTGNLHYQGYVCFKNNQRFASLKKLLPSTHWEKRRGTHTEAKDYCMKRESRVNDDVDFVGGDDSLIGEKGKRTDILLAKRKLDEGGTELEVAEQFFGTWARNYRAFGKYIQMKTKKRDWMPDVYIYWGKPGSGKSKKAHLENPNAFWKQPGTKWWCGYNGEEVVILDDYRNWFDESFLLRLCDRYPMTVETKNGNVQFLAKKIIFTCNHNPKEWGLSEWNENNPFVRRIKEIKEMN